MIKILNIPIYKTTVVMMADTSMEEWKAFAQLYKDKVTDDDYRIIAKDIRCPETCDGSSFSLDEGDFALFVRNKENVGDVAHEIFHAANLLLCSRGVTHDAAGEAWAYLIGHITEEFYDMIHGKSDDVFTLEQETEQKEITDIY